MKVEEKNTYYCATCGYRATVKADREEIKCKCDMCKKIQVFFSAKSVTT